jgi:hypothetical protein
LVEIVNVVIAECFDDCLEETLLEGLRVDGYVLFEYAVSVPRGVLAYVASRVGRPVNYVLGS